ncbi:MAG: hypothetical protein ABW163_04470 [Luteimonas sp.]
METLQVLTLLYPLYGVPAIVGCGLAWGATWYRIGQRPRLHLYDGLLPVVPYLVWLMPEAVIPLGKTLNNAREGTVLGVVVAVLFGVRLLLAAARPDRTRGWSAGALAGSCAAALAIWRFVPAL